MTSRQRYTQKQIIDALRETKGMVYLAAKRLGCEAQTVYNYRDRYPAVRAEMEQQDGEVDDAAEMVLYRAIMAGESWAVQFRLRTKGRKRGYGDAVELTGKDGGDIGVKHTLGADLMTAIERVYGSDSSNGGDSGDSDGSDETPN